MREVAMQSLPARPLLQTPVVRGRPAAQRLRKTARLERVRRACATYRQQRYDEQQVMREALRYSRLGFSELVALLREVEGWEL